MSEQPQSPRRGVGRPKAIDDQQVLRLAKEIFSRRGYAVSTREIAEFVGLSQATLFQRFESKEALFVASLGIDSIDVDSLLAGAAAKDTLIDALAELLQGLTHAVTLVLPTMLHAHSAPTLDKKLLDSLHQRLGVERLHTKCLTVIEKWREVGLLRRDVTAHHVLQVLLYQAHGIALTTMANPDSHAVATEPAWNSISQLLSNGLAPCSMTSKR